MIELSAKLDPAVREVVEPLLERWEIFRSRVEERIREVYTEANAGVDEIMTVSPVDPEPLFAAFRAFESRFLKIAKKVWVALEEFEESWDNLMKGSDHGGQEPTLEKVLDLVRGQARNLDRALNAKRDSWQKKKQADWGRQLARLADRERGYSVACSGCSSALKLASLHTIGDAICQYCGAINLLKPPPATLAYYSQGVNYLAGDAASAELEAMHGAQEEYERRSSSRSRGAYKAAIEAYWSRYYREVQALYPAHPHLVDGLETAIERKTKHASIGIY